VKHTKMSDHSFGLFVTKMFRLTGFSNIYCNKLFCWLHGGSLFVSQLGQHPIPPGPLAPNYSVPVRKRFLWPFSLLHSTKRIWCWDFCGFLHNCWQIRVLQLHSIYFECKNHKLWLNCFVVASAKYFRHERKQFANQRLENESEVNISKINKCIAQRNVLNKKFIIFI